jgi:DNA-binding transcriptional ArsR family regulator
MAGGEAKRDSQLLVSLRHPLRRQILRAMIAAKVPTNPRRIAEELHEPLSNVSYHVRVLADHGAATLRDTEPVRGSLKHLYEPSVTEAWALAVLGLGDDDPAPEDPIPAADSPGPRAEGEA